MVEESDRYEPLMTQQFETRNDRQIELLAMTQPASRDVLYSKQAIDAFRQKSFSIMPLNAAGTDRAAET